MSQTSANKKDKSTEKIRQPLPYLFEKELIRKQNKPIYFIHEFLPTERTYPIEGKFYSRHNEEKVNASKYLQFVGNSYRRPQSKYKFPLLESHSYGWIPSDISRAAYFEMNSVSAPKCRCDLTVFGEKLISERVTQRPHFNGLRFYLR